MLTVQVVSKDTKFKFIPVPSELESGQMGAQLFEDGIVNARLNVCPFAVMQRARLPGAFVNVIGTIFFNVNTM